MPSSIYELAEILGHSNIKMTERYAKLGHAHMAETGGTAREMWKLLGKKETADVPVSFPSAFVVNEGLSQSL